MISRCISLILMAAVSSAWAESPADGFALEDDDAGRLTVLHGGAPVLVYNYGRVDPPEGVNAERYWRSSYIHPLYGINGEVITQDFPSDHYHHRGVFWTWPEVTVGDRRMDIWTIRGARQLFEAWIDREADEERATVTVQNVWRFDDDPEPKVRETISFTVYPAIDNGRAIDFDLSFTNVCSETVTLLGAENKGYGGFCFRPDANNRPLRFTAADGVVEEDALSYTTAWADVSWTSKATGEKAGAAIFQHAANPGYPHDGWIFRHYGFLGASWPHEQTHAIEPGESIRLRYRLFIHAGSAEDTDIVSAWAEYKLDHAMNELMFGQD